MARCIHSLAVLTIALVALWSPSYAGDKSFPVTLTRTWGGKIDIELRNEAPSRGYVANKDDWIKLWKAYRGEDPIPTIDFEKELVIVTVGRDPNRIGVRLMVDKQGNVDRSVYTTSVLYFNPTTCSYQFAVIDRQGIRRIGGQPIQND